MTRTVQFKRLARLNYGDAIPQEDQGRGNVPVFGSNGAFTICDEANTLAPVVLLGRKGSFGKTNWSDVPCWATDTTFFVDQRNASVDLRWLYWALQTLGLDAESAEAAVPGINREEVYEKRLPEVSAELQKRTAAYLDNSTGLIDRLLATKSRLLDLLAEKRRVVIADFLTKGLNKDAPRRDSGIPWLGDIPEHWDVERAKWLFTERDDRSDSGDEELLTVSHLTGVTSRAEKDVNMFMAESLEGYKRCQSGDLVINTLWAWMGAMGVARQPGIVSPAYNVYQPVAQLDPEYVDFLVRTPRFVEEITRYSKGVWSSRLRLYPEGLYEAWLPVPPLDEQRAIMKHVQIETKKLDVLAATTKRTIALLQERRSALISAAVTGQLEIGEATV
jgi:type I restriction enzyme S subunit